MDGCSAAAPGGLIATAGDVLAPLTATTRTIRVVGAMDANPASIDPAAPDVDVDDLHDFGDVDLVALRRLTRVFPEEASSVTQHLTGPGST